MDGLVGPSHMFGGLAPGDIAATMNRGRTSSPKIAVLQGLSKMKQVMDAGIPQALMLPQERPNLGLLRSLGFTGTDKYVLLRASHEAPSLLRASYSASSMWVANAATITPGVDTLDGRIHLTPANLVSNVHRSFEAVHSATILQYIFPNISLYQHHPALPYTTNLGDEGAANHIRFCHEDGGRGLHLFVFGRYTHLTQRRGNQDTNHSVPKLHPARQSYEASQAIARVHCIPDEQVIFAQQNPSAIDKGVFHNDVISTGHQRFFLYHQHAFVDTECVISELQRKWKNIHQESLHLHQVQQCDLTIEEAVETYLFNSQILTNHKGNMFIIAPIECRRSARARAVLEKLVTDSQCPITDLSFIDLSQSMANGGGPACLRLRVPLTQAELSHVNQKFLLTNELYAKLRSWADKYYPDELHPDPATLSSEALMHICHTALDNLTQILGVGSLYQFQQV